MCKIIFVHSNQKPITVYNKHSVNSSEISTKTLLKEMSRVDANCDEGRTE